MHKARYFELIGEVMALCGNVRPASLLSSMVNLDTEVVNARDFFHSLESLRLGVPTAIVEWKRRVGQHRHRLKRVPIFAKSSSADPRVYLEPIPVCSVDEEFDGFLQHLIEPFQR